LPKGKANHWTRSDFLRFLLLGFQNPESLIEHSNSVDRQLAFSGLSHFLGMHLRQQREQTELELERKFIHGIMYEVATPTYRRTVKCSGRSQE
jgi:hypothetical protein